MSTVVLHAVVSVDGFVADPHDDPGPLFDWYFNGDQPLAAQDMADPSPGGLRVSKTSYDHVRPVWDATGCMVIGRHLFDTPTGGKVVRPPVTTWSWCPTGRSPRGGTRRRRTPSSTT